MSPAPPVPPEPTCTIRFSAGVTVIIPFTNPPPPPVPPAVRGELSPPPPPAPPAPHAFTSIIVTPAGTCHVVVPTAKLSTVVVAAYTKEVNGGNSNATSSI